MKVLVIAAHPDDEVLGCGATIAKHALRGDVVHVLILAEGITSRDLQPDREKRNYELSALAEVPREAAKILGAASVELHNFPDNRLDSCNLLDIVKVVEQAIDKHQPEIIYTHHRGDLNIDHCYVHQAVVTATRPLPNRSVKTLLFFEIASSTEWQTPYSAPIFAPNWFVDVSDTISLKLKALEAYQSEMRPWPHARSIIALEHLAHWRGATIGVEAAEAFMLGRNITH
ncbi:MAG: PIG-L family deacetylase [Okeania sp. SIO3I5]|uniref:PIG-L deacetylase family protein n=1 Tax=Okeania sp. SIO3I5 TaxID=2607805 RepID=UPI0013BA1A38|nr:PIG-L deacetylase family protein [Okeania sp. SIO3I5]NEQ36718.1 PIG-L family deacetylase [Okeania sp. SIO3I5]